MEYELSRFGYQEEVEQLLKDLATLRDEKTFAALRQTAGTQDIFDSRVLDWPRYMANAPAMDRHYYHQLHGFIRMDIWQTLILPVYNKRGFLLLNKDVIDRLARAGYEVVSSVPALGFFTTGEDYVVIRTKAN